MSILHRDELIAITSRILNADGTESEIDELIEILESDVPHPTVSNLIFSPLNGKTLTAEQVIDIALSFRPVAPDEG